MQRNARTRDTRRAVTLNQLQAIFDADVAAGAGSSPAADFWMDEMLARTPLPAGEATTDA